MSEKELLYTEDVLAHLSSINEYLNNYCYGVEDEKFKKILEDLQSLTKSVYKKYYKLIEE